MKLFFTSEKKSGTWKLRRVGRSSGKSSEGRKFCFFGITPKDDNLNPDTFRVRGTSNFNNESDLKEELSERFFIINGNYKMLNRWDRVVNYEGSHFDE